MDPFLTDCDYELNGQEFDVYYLKICPLYPIPKDSTDIHPINILGTETNDVRTLQQQDAYCKCINKKLHIPSVKKSPQKMTHYSNWYKMEIDHLEP